MNTLACQTDQQLQDFDQGLCSGEQSGQIARHLDECAKCAARFQNLPPVSDPLLERLRQPLPDDVLQDDPESLECVRRTLAMAGTAMASTDETTTPESSSPPVDVIAELIKRLAPAEADDELGRLGRYCIREVLGTGGMGVVFRAEDRQLHRMVALKVMKPALAATDIERRRFLREARSMAAMQHDHVVTIHEVGEDRGIPFLAMSLLQGESLGNRLRRERKLNPNEALRIAREAATGLDAISKLGFCCYHPVVTFPSRRRWDGGGSGVG